MAAPTLRFPLYERAERLGVLNGKSALIVAPTATGKSHIGRQAIRRALQRGVNGTHVYLVPFRALAAEVFESFLEILSGTNTRVRIVTGDHRDPFRPDQADLVVATYESFIGLLRNAQFQPGIIVADEVHLVGDDERGPVVEGLFARLLASGRAPTICALSAVVDNAEEIAQWLGVLLIEGTPDDRPVPLVLESQVAEDLDEALSEALKPCADGKQALVFCSSRPGAEKTARLLTQAIGDVLTREQRKSLRRIADLILEADPGSGDLVDVTSAGVAYHHAGLPKPVRHTIEKGFRDGVIRIVTGTTTLAAGVNLPAEIAVVRDVFRSEVVRGVPRRVLLPDGEILNMLGRAGRPYQAASGMGIALIEKQHEADPAVASLLKALREGRGGTVTSRLPESFEGLMRFALDVIVELGEATRDDVGSEFSRTLAYVNNPSPVNFDRSFEEDIMEDIEAYRKVIDAEGRIFLKQYHLSPDGVHALIKSSENQYEVVLGVGGIRCTCPAASKFYRGRICKHQACAIHELLFGKRVDEEARTRAIYNCGHVFGRSLDLGTRLSQALSILTAWGFVERIPGGWRATPVGRIASATGFDLLFVHQAIKRVSDVRGASFDHVAQWTVEDYFEDEQDRRRWKQAVRDWIGEVDIQKIKLPTRYRGDFDQKLEDLSRVCLLYEKAALALGNRAVADASRGASGALRYGVAPELVPLTALNLRQLARARSRYLFEKGVKNLRDLANGDPHTLADPRRMPEPLVREWVERAKEIHQARAVASADTVEAEAEFDELTARFGVDPAALT